MSSRLAHTRTCSRVPSGISSNLFHSLQHISCTGIGAMSTTSGTPESAAFLSENRQAEVYVVSTVFFILSLLCVSGRLISARILGKSLWWDDWFAIIAAVS